MYGEGTGAAFRIFRTKAKHARNGIAALPTVVKKRYLHARTHESEREKERKSERERERAAMSAG